jgi:hypothetical protein
VARRHCSDSSLWRGASCSSRRVWNQDSSGLLEAIWLLCLFFLPFLTALVYVIVRGKSMADRSVVSARAARKQREDYIRDVAGSATPTDQITRAKAMLDDGTISQSEFDLLKAKTLAI